MLAKLNDGVDCTTLFTAVFRRNNWNQPGYEKGKNYRIFQAKKKKKNTLHYYKVGCAWNFMIFDYCGKSGEGGRVLKVLNVVLEKLGMAT